MSLFWAIFFIHLLIVANGKARANSMILGRQMKMMIVLLTALEIEWVKHSSSQQILSQMRATGFESPKKNCTKDEFPYTFSKVLGMIFVLK